MTPENRKSWLHQEENRLRRYQNQHRGLGFKKFLLPPVNDRKVNLVGRDNHIYRGSVARVREDQLPPEVDESSIDEEALYKEIANMDFPPVPEQEPLGPSRRIGGEYTLAKKLTLAPVQMESSKGLEDTLILGKDGSIYRGKGKHPSKIELDKKLRGTKRPIQKIVRTSSTRGYVEPSLVSLHTSGKSPLYGKISKSLIEFPKTEIVYALALIKEKSMKEENEEVTDTTVLDEATAKPKQTEMRSETDIKEQQETDIGIPAETDAEIPAETDADIPAETDAEIPTETDSEIPAETDSEIPAETDAEIMQETESESGESSATVDTEETTAEESDTETVSSAENIKPDTDKSVELEESLDTGETKETDIEELSKSEESPGTAETKETASESGTETVKPDTGETANEEESKDIDDTKDVSNI